MHNYHNNVVPTPRDGKNLGLQKKGFSFFRLLRFFLDFSVKEHWARILRCRKNILYIYVTLLLFTE